MKTNNKFFLKNETLFYAKESSFGMGFFLLLINVVVLGVLYYVASGWIALLVGILQTPLIGVALFLLFFRQSFRFDASSGEFEIVQSYLFHLDRKQDALSAIDYVEFSYGWPQGIDVEAPFWIRLLLAVMSGKPSMVFQKNDVFKKKAGATKSTKPMISIIYQNHRLPFPGSARNDAALAVRLAKLIGCRVKLPEGMTEVEMQKAGRVPRKLKSTKKIAFGQQKKGREVRPAIYSLLLFIGGICFAFSGYYANEGYQTTQWPSVKGEIFESKYERFLSSGGTGSATTKYRPVIRYRYMLKSKHYVGKQIGVMKYSSIKSKKADAVARKYKRGSRVTIYYNPENPEEAVLEQGVPYVLFFGLIVSSLSLLSGFVLRREFQLEKGFSPARRMRIGGWQGFSTNYNHFRISYGRWYLGAIIAIFFSPLPYMLWEDEIHRGDRMLAVGICAVIYLIAFSLLFYKKMVVIDKDTGRFSIQERFLFPFKQVSKPLSFIEGIELDSTKMEHSYNFSLSIDTDDGKVYLTDSASLTTPEIARRLAVLIGCPVFFTGTMEYWRMSEGIETPEEAAKELKNISN